MRETYELRVRDEFADMLFGPHEGRPLEIVRLVRVPATDSRVSEIARLQRELKRTKGKPFFYGWDVLRKYSRRELTDAELLLLEVTSGFEPAGEECGTIQFDGARRGLLRPERFVFVSPQVWKVLDREKVRGLRFEVARLM